MRHLSMVAACAAVCLPSLALAEEGESPPAEKPALERHLLLPALVAAGYDPLPGYVGVGALSTGLVSYGRSETADGQRAEALVLRPSFDVRLGRFTLGTGSSLAHQYLRGPDGGTSTGLSFKLEPRVGYLVPITRDVSFWPRVGLGYVFGQASGNMFGNADNTAQSVVGSVDALLVLGIGSHLFATAGPTLSGQYSWSDRQPSGWNVAIGASIGLGLAI